MPTLRQHAIWGCTLLVTSWGCTDAGGTNGRANSSQPPVQESDASTPGSAPASAPNAPSTTNALPPPAAPLDPNSEVDAGPPPVEDPSLWLAADHFSVAVQRSACYGICPVFSVSVDEHGHVAYRGTDNVARPGYYEVDVPPDSVRQLFVDMIDAGFLQLGRQYGTEADGCKEVSTDAPTSTFTLTAGEHSKEVRMYWGCEIDLSSTLQQLDDEIEHVTTVGRFLYPNPGFESCPSGDSRDLPESWVVANSPDLDHTDLGLLRIERSDVFDAHWWITDCQGQPIADGEDVRTDCTEQLLPPKDVDAYFAWPGLDDPQGIASLERTGLEHWITIDLLDLLDEHEQWAREGQACDQ